MVNRALISLLLLAIACGGVHEPTGFGVNLRIDASSLSAADRARITQARLDVSGDEVYTKTFAIGNALAKGEGRLRYLPGVKSGALTFAITALADTATDTVIATGQSTSVTLSAGHSVDATIALTGSALPPGDLLGVVLDFTQTITHSDGGTTLLAQGSACTAAAQCATAGGCVDGYCCDTTCGDACNACDIAGKEGSCSPVELGHTPEPNHPTCGPDPKSGCQRDGTCNGLGQCALWHTGTVCKSSVCKSTDNTLTPQSTCDGAGVCVTPVTQIACDPYLCQDATSCYTSCTQAAGQCVDPKPCTGGSCGPKPSGSLCPSGASECQSGKCIEGVCCATDCPGPCESCNQPGKAGQCVVVATRGQDPRSMCPQAAGFDGACRPGGCDGTTNQCAVSASGTPCNGVCTNNTPTNRTCDTAGSCSQSSTAATCPLAQGAGVECKPCTVSNNVAACRNAPDNTVQCFSGGCFGMYRLSYATYCTSGDCPSTQTTITCPNGATCNSSTNMCN